MSEKDQKLWYAAGRGDNNEVGTLLADGADIEYTYPGGRTPLLAAASRGHLSTVQLLVDSGAVLHKKDGMGNTCAHIVSMKGNLDLLQYLSKKGLSAKETDDSGENCLHKACSRGHLKLITWLTNQGLSLHTPNKKGKTPLDYLKEKEKYDVATNKRRQECLEALEISSKDTAEPDLQAEVKKSAFDIDDVTSSIKQVNGKMKVARVLLHGGPQVGKTSVKRLIFNYPPLAKEHEQSTQLLEDPVRAISTRRMMSTDERNLEEVDETKLIQMIQQELKSHLSKRKREEKIPDQSCSYDSGPTDLDDESGPPLKKFRPSSEETAETPTKMPVVLADIAKDLDSADPNTPPLFNCKFVHLVDSGGQPQFSDLLPLVFQSESHDHIAVIPLNERLNSKPKNCVNINGKRLELPDSLLLTHFQLVERVCQLAKASESRVMVVGTHLDQEDEEEPLAKKMKLLNPLLEKYQDNLVQNEDGSVIFPVNAMASEGEQREEYATMLQELILDACCIDEEKTVPIRWMALELELSRRSRESGEILEKSECDEVAKSLAVNDLDGALTFFNELAVHYYYPEAIPGVIFTSVGAISSRLSAVVEASFLCNAKKRDARRLRETGKLTKRYLVELLSKLPKTKLFTADDFLRLIRHLRIVFSVDDHTLFIPSLLPVDQTVRTLDCYRPEPLAFYWYDNEYQEVRILPQSFFHALIVDLLHKVDTVELSKAKQSRSSIVLNLTLENRKEHAINLVNSVFWLELFVEHTFSSEDIPFLTQIIQDSSCTVVEQLKLTKTLGQLQYGLLCPGKCGNENPHLCASSGPGSEFKCLEDWLCKWEEKDEARLYWINCSQQKGLPSSSEGVALVPAIPKVEAENFNDFHTQSEQTIFKDGLNQATLEIKIRQIQNRTYEPGFQRAQGIIFIVGVYGADGTAKDVENIEATFKELNFAIFIERDPTSSQIACLIKAAAACQYPYRYEYIAFYFAGHGGRDQSNGKLFIKGLQLDESDPEILHIEEFVVQPLKEINRLKKLCLFDCCQTPGSGRAYRDREIYARDLKPVPGMLIAYSTSEGQKSFGDNTNGGIWTYHLCKNLKKKETATKVLSMTSDDVSKLRKEFQEPVTVCSDEFHQLMLQSGSSLPIESQFDEEHANSNRNSPVQFQPSSLSDNKQEDKSESLLNKRPLLKDVFDLTASHSSDWNDLGRTLQVSHNYRKQLRKEASSDKDKLEDMLEKWMETESVPVTWSSLIEALEAIELMDLVRAVKDFLKTPKAIRTYSKSCHS